MKLLTLPLCGLFLCSTAMAEKRCFQVGDPSTSEVKISYNDSLEPIQISLRSPDSDEFRPLGLLIELVFPMDEQGNHSFSAKPHSSNEIDWSKEVNCYKDIGTQMYFQFARNGAYSAVTLTPLYLKSDERCQPPRNQPQVKRLDCVDNFPLKI